jgi:hypothetical protein
MALAISPWEVGQSLPIGSVPELRAEYQGFA